MDKDKFWEIIDTTLENYQNTMTSYLDELSHQLEKLTPDEVIQWDCYFSSYMELSYREKLWAGAFIMNKGECTDDGFDYFRAWLISMGKDYYLEILANVDELAELIVTNAELFIAEFEEVLYVGQEVFIEKLKRLGGNTEIDLESVYFDFAERLSLSEEQKKALLKEITYDNDIDLEWVETRTKLFKKQLPKLSEKYLEFMDKNASRWEIVGSLLELEDVDETLAKDNKFE